MFNIIYYSQRHQHQSTPIFHRSANNGLLIKATNSLVMFNTLPVKANKATPAATCVPEKNAPTLKRYSSIIKIDFDDIWQKYLKYSRIEFVCFSFRKLKHANSIARVFCTFLPNVIEIDRYDFELYRLKVGAFFLRHSVYALYLPFAIWHSAFCLARKLRLEVVASSNTTAPGELETVIARCVVVPAFDLFLARTRVNGQIACLIYQHTSYSSVAGCFGQKDWHRLQFAQTPAQPQLPHQSCFYDVSKSVKHHFDSYRFVDS